MSDHDDEEGEPETLSAPDPFEALLDRFMTLRTRLLTLRDVLGDLNKLPNEFHAAGSVLGETAEDVCDLYEDLETWHGAYDHSMREGKAQLQVERRRSVFRSSGPRQRYEVEGSPTRRVGRYV